MTEGGSSHGDQIGLEMGSPPLPTASPPQGGEGDLIKGLRKGERFRVALLQRSAADGMTAVLISAPTRRQHADQQQPTQQHQRSRDPDQRVLPGEWTRDFEYRA